MPTRAAYFDGLQKTSFGGIPFPVDHITVTGSLRRFVHEYPHTPGGAPEKLGRKLYEIKLESAFDEGIALYPALYPSALEDLFALFEEETTADLTVGTMGTIKAYCTNWSRDMVAPVRSGERVELQFEEDQSSLFLINELLVRGSSSLPALQQELRIQFAKIETPQDVTPLQVDRDRQNATAGIFDAIDGLVTSVLALRDSADIAGNLLEAKVLALTALCDQADRTVDFMQDPLNTELIEALKRLWESSQDLADDLLGKTNPLKTYTTPKRMGITDVSVKLYGTTERSFEILQINSVDDAFAIPAGTALKYYDNAA